MNPFFQPYGLHIGGVIHLSPREAFELLPKGALIVDVREPMEMNGKSFAVEDVVLLPYSHLAEEFATLPRDRPLILADSVGLNSKQAVLFLKEHGFSEIANLNGGIIDWEKDGLPTDIDDDEVLIGQCACKLRPKKLFRKKEP
ncbi:MAG: rhodanese-like domain-containing protein [Candidatus Riflebacteria bacterium]|nr:rhodanese-like domain-containing protein [Candidatus Riflebacteria bacterium]